MILNLLMILIFLLLNLEYLFFMVFWLQPENENKKSTLLNGIAPYAKSVWSFTNDLLALLGTRLTYGHKGTIGEHGHNC